MFPARKVTRARRNPQKDLPEGEIAADALTADLRTQKNSLSFRRCKAGASGTVEAEEVTSAIVVTGNCIDEIRYTSLTNRQMDKQTPSPS